MASPYSMSESHPLRSAPMARASADCGPCREINTRTRMVNATRSHEQIDAVHRDRECREVGVAHPRRCERRERQPEEQMDVRPENSPVDVPRGVQQVVVIVPVDRDEDEREDVAEGRGDERPKGLERLAVRRAELEDEDRDDDGDHAIGERFESTLGHDLADATSAGRPAT